MQSPCTSSAFPGGCPLFNRRPWDAEPQPWTQRPWSSLRLAFRSILGSWPLEFGDSVMGEGDVGLFSSTKPWSTFEQLVGNNKRRWELIL